jgi:hypothetical protein
MAQTRSPEPMPRLKPQALQRELQVRSEPSAAAIAGWVRGAEAEDGARPDVTTARPRPSAGNWLACVAGTAGSGRRATSWQGERRSRSKPGGPRPRRTPGGPRPRTGVRVDATEPGRASDPRHGPCSGRLDLGFPRLARPPAGGSAEKRCRPGSRRLRAIHAVPHGTCGAPRVQADALACIADIPASRLDSLLSWKWAAVQENAQAARPWPTPNGYDVYTGIDRSAWIHAWLCRRMERRERLSLRSSGFWLPWGVVPDDCVEEYQEFCVSGGRPGYVMAALGP